MVSETNPKNETFLSKNKNKKKKNTDASTHSQWKQ